MKSNYLEPWKEQQSHGLEIAFIPGVQCKPDYGKEARECESEKAGCCGSLVRGENRLLQMHF